MAELSEMADDAVLLRIGIRGRAVIPVSLRRTLDLQLGQVLIGRVEDGRLILESRDVVLQRLQARFVSAVPSNVSLADELIAERREQFRHEAHER